nr:glycosyltransferase family 39 protein [Shewanella sp. NIFS-20-20]
MLANHQWFVLQVNDQLYPDKPPLYFWLLATIFHWQPHDPLPWALILLGVIPFLATVYLGYCLVNRIADKPTAQLFALAYISLPYAFGVSLALRMDTLMTLCIVAAIGLLVRQYQAPEQHSRYWFLPYVLIGTGILIKGGAAILVPLLTIVSLLTLNRDWHAFAAIKLAKGLVIIAAMVTIWLLLVSFQNQGIEYIELLLGQQTLGRMVNASIHREPFYYYLYNMPLILLPISPFFIAGLARLIYDLPHYRQWPIIDKVSFCWLVPSFIFLSVVSSKLVLYLLPLLPPAIVISCRFLQRVCSRYATGLCRIQLRFSVAILLIGVLALPWLNTRYTLAPIALFLKHNQATLYSYHFANATHLEGMIANSILPIYRDKISSLPVASLVITSHSQPALPEEFKPLLTNQAFTLYQKSP